MNKPTISIEKLTKFSSEDMTDIKRLTAMLGVNFKPLTDADLQEMVSSPNLFLFVAREQEKQHVIGMILLAVYRIPYTKKAYLDDLVVDEEFRGQAIGSRLLQTAIDMAQKLGASYAELTSNPKRITSNKLYEKFGFTKRETNVYRLIYDK